jgi:two-component system, sensor histidine kinase PdtaS
VPELHDPPGHLTRLTAMWGLVADLSFSDLVLVVPTTPVSVLGEPVPSWTVIAQIRPTTHQTLYQDDLVGTSVSSAERPALQDSWASGSIIEANVQAFVTAQPARSRVIPVGLATGHIRAAAVLSEEALDTGRRRGRLERAYVEIYDELCEMIRLGSFPFADDPATTDMPRVGDGLLVLDAAMRITFASPNATSALHRLGVLANADGRRLDELGLDDSWLPTSRRLYPSSTEFEPIRQPIQQPLTHPTATIAATYLPLVERSLILLRDVTDVRRRDRMILSKEASIREVHHRVKNNLQTISALLRLQGRRLASPEAKAAIEESVRRIRSIALVHETLSQGVSAAVPFNDVIRPLVRIVEEGLQVSERPVRFVIEGAAGELPPEIATPLAVVLVELLQNAVEHAYGPTGGEVRVRFDRLLLPHDDQGRAKEQLTVRIADKGSGFPPGFSLSTNTSLGLTIVRTLIASELGGVISTTNDGGAIVELRIPL